MQDDKPLAFYSRKMNSTQQNYTTGEQELLSIVETLKEFRNILLGQDLVVHTDHKNIIHGNLTNSRIARWQLLLEEFGPKYIHIAGKDNVVADALSRMEANFEEANATLKQEVRSQVCAYTLSHMILDEDMLMPDANDQFEMAYAFGETDVDNEAFPLHPELIALEQKKDRTLMKSVKKNKEAYVTHIIEDNELIMYNNKIVVPYTLRQKIVAWYHEYLVHPGSTQMEATLRQTLTWPNMQKD